MWWLPSCMRVTITQLCLCISIYREAWDMFCVSIKRHLLLKMSPFYALYEGMGFCFHPPFQKVSKTMRDPFVNWVAAFFIEKKKEIKIAKLCTIVFWGNWSGYEAPLWSHFACTFKSGDVGYCWRLTRVRERVCLWLYRLEGEGRVLVLENGREHASTNSTRPHFQNACNMTSQGCFVAWPISLKKQLYASGNAVIRTVDLWRQ